MDENWFAEFNRLYNQLTEHVSKGVEKAVLSLMSDLPLGPVSQAFLGKLGQVGPPRDMPLDDCYRMLGLEPTASGEDVEHRYRELVKRLHPDAAGAETAHLFQMVTLAYHEISKRKQAAS